jgi:adenine-specific DNA-methyltransferase
MEKLKLHTTDMAERNVELLGQMFPNCLTETINADGKLVRAIDFDKLRQELACEVVEGAEERYQFTWPDKRAAIRLANAPTNKTLRPCREESVNFDNTENLYIEGDNLEVLKLLRENYLGKVKMIYIDPPYNTGNDFVYNDDFAQGKAEFEAQSGLFDEEGRRMADPMVQNTESNGRFHTDWLNMIYPRLKVAKDLLADDGAILIHIDEHEVSTLEVICKEVYGAHNYLGTIIWDKRNPKGSVAGVAYQHESILVYCKDITTFSSKNTFLKEKENANTMISVVNALVKKYKGVTNEVREEYKLWIKKNAANLSGGELAYSLIDDSGAIYQPVSMAAPDKPETRSHRPLIHPVTGKPCPVPAKGWRFTDARMDEILSQNRVEFGKDETTQPRQKYFLHENMKEAVSSLIYFGGSDDAMGLPFDNPKPVYIAKRLISSVSSDSDIVLDFFSGSATTAHAVMQLNAEDGGNRKFIMVQLPELTYEGKKEKFKDSKGEEHDRFIIDETTGYPVIVKDSDARKAGYWTIPQIGKERIRRAGKKIKEEAGLQGQNLDTGFRVLKLDESNMADVFYTPADMPIQQTLNFDALVDNIREGRTAEDLLFQVLPECNLPLSSKIEIREIHGKKVFVVEDGYLMACFDSDINDAVITAIAKEKPYYFVMCDRSIASDSVADNFDQIFNAYSKDTVRRIL